MSNSSCRSRASCLVHHRLPTPARGGWTFAALLPPQSSAHLRPSRRRCEAWAALADLSPETKHLWSLESLPYLCIGPRLLGTPDCQGCQGVYELRAHNTVVLLLETTETTLEAFGRGRGPIWLHTVASLPASRSEGDPPSIDMGVPRRLQRERGSGRSYSSGREGESERAPWQPWSHWEAQAGREKDFRDDALRAIEGSVWSIGLGEHSPDLGSRSASRPVAIASSAPSPTCCLVVCSTASQRALEL